jgi:hypothetical protein
LLYNAVYAELREAGYNFASGLPQDAWSVGVGWGLAEGLSPDERWNGHLIAIAGHSWMGDFSIRQAERPGRGIVTGPAVISPYAGQRSWTLSDGLGMGIRYETIEDCSYLRAPDWREAKRRRPVVGRIIRRLAERMPRSA